MHQVQRLRIFSRLTLLAVVFLISFGMAIPAYAGYAILTWDAPTTNTDGSPLTDLAGYKIYYGTSSGSYSNNVNVGNVTTYTITGLTEGATYYFTVTAYNTSGRESTFSNESSKIIPTTPDTTPPVISGVTTINITGNSAIINWTTDEASTSQVEYGTTTSYGMTTTLDNTLVTSHSTTLSALSSWTTYHYRVKSQDASGNLTISPDYTFTTLDPPDTAPPTGSILINNGSTYTNSATVTLALTCTDGGSGCKQMRLSDNGTTWNAWESYVTSKTWTLSNTNGNKTVYIQFIDNNSNVSLTYSDAIILDMAAPLISAVGSGNITSSSSTITWTTDEASTTQVEYGTTTGYGSSTNINTSAVKSHSASLTGLSVSTTYHYRVKSVDIAGNSAVSADYTFTTLPAPQPEQPASITDLTVRAGASTRNSVVLDWTATGANGNEGSASSYDLRMSNQKIIEDGMTPAEGEVNFSNATRITGTPAPKAAGSAESFQIRLLETNSAYYFAIKAIDEIGNASAISNVINENSIPPMPVTAVRNGYTMISFPMTPSTANVQTLLGSVVGTQVELYWWSSDGLGDNTGRFIAEQTIVPGYGYFLKANTDNIVLNISGTEITDASRSISLQPGWNMIGNPYPKEIPVRNLFVRNIDTGELKSYQDAVVAGWVENAVYSYNGSTYDYAMHLDATLKLWQGYWIAVLQSGQFELVIYKP